MIGIRSASGERGVFVLGRLWKDGRNRIPAVSVVTAAATLFAAAAGFFVPVRSSASETPYGQTAAVLSVSGSCAEAEEAAGAFLVRYRPGAAGLLPETVRRLEAMSGGEVRAQSPNAASVGSVWFTVPILAKRAADVLADDPNVAFAEPACPVLIADDPSTPGDPYFTYQWQLVAVGLPNVWPLVSQQARTRVTVAVLDTGVDLSHEDLAAALVSGYDFVANDPVPEDRHGHGTHVAGVVAAVADNAVGVAGAASGVRLMPVKVVDDSGRGNTAALVQGIYWAVDHGADVVNLSVGSPYPSAFLEEAIRYAVRHGVIVIAAAGNGSDRYPDGSPGDLGRPSGSPASGFGGTMVRPVEYPAAYAEAIAVGALDRAPDGAWRPADFSNGGDELDISAPGVDVLGPDLSSRGVSRYAFRSGTSAATPIASGLAALLLAADPSLLQARDERRVEAVRRRLQETAFDVGPPGFDPDTGFGLIDAREAFGRPSLRPEPPEDRIEGQVPVRISVRAYDGSLVENAFGAGELEVVRASGASETPVEKLSFVVRNGTADVVWNASGVDPGRYFLRARSADRKWVSGWTDVTVVSGNGVTRRTSVEGGNRVLRVVYSENAAVARPDAAGERLLDARTLPGEAAVDVVEVEFPASWRPIGGVSLRVRADETEWRFEPGALPIEAEQGTIVWRAEREPVAPASVVPDGFVLCSDVWHVSVRVDGTPVDLFGAPVEARVANRYGCGRPERTAAFVRADVEALAPKEGWRWAGGDRESDGKWAFRTETPGRIAVMSYVGTFADIAGHWAKEDIEALAARMTVGGTGGGRFEPDRPVTRAEFVAMLVRAFGLSVSGAVAKDERFADVPSGAWYASAVNAAARAGWMEGYGSGRFGPDDPVTREQMAVVLARAFPTEKADAGDTDIKEVIVSRFVDAADISGWARDAVAEAAAAGRLSGYPDGRFRPRQPATRAEAAAFIRRLLERPGAEA